MIDYFALALTHGLLLYALIRLARGGEVADPDGAGDAPRVAETRREARDRRRSNPEARDA